jgi:hypothetical protein
VYFLALAKRMISAMAGKKVHLAVSRASRGAAVLKTSRQSGIEHGRVVDPTRLVTAVRRPILTPMDPYPPAPAR